MKLYNILIFRLALALNEHGLKMPILANTLFDRQISLSQHFEQRNCNVPRFSYDAKFLTMQLRPTRGPIKGFVRPSLGFRCSESILYSDNPSLF